MFVALLFELCLRKQLTIDCFMTFMRRLDPRMGWQKCQFGFSSGDRLTISIQEGFSSPSFFQRTKYCSATQVPVHNLYTKFTSLTLQTNAIRVQLLITSIMLLCSIIITNHHCLSPLLSFFLALPTTTTQTSWNPQSSL